MATSIVEACLSLAGESLGEDRGRLLAAYLEVYSAHLPGTFLERTPPPLLLEFVLDRLRFLEEDFATPVKVRIGRPRQGLPHQRTGVSVVETRVPDCTFLVRTLKEFFRKRNLHLHFVVHPLVGVFHDGHRVTGIDPRAEKGTTISHVYFHVNRIPDAEIEFIRKELEYRLQAVVQVNGDFQPLMSRLSRVREGLLALSRVRGEMASEAAEAVELVDWLANQNFIFLGYGYLPAGRERAAEFREPGGGSPSGRLARPVGEGGTPIGSPLGLLRIEGEKELSELARGVAEGRLDRDEVVSFYRTDYLSVVKSETQVRYVGFKDADARGRTAGEHFFLGILSSNSINERNSRIPIISTRMKEVLESQRLHRGSYAYRKVFAILNSVPNEDLFYSTPDEIRDLTRFIREAEAADHTSVQIARRSPGRRIGVVCVMPRAGFSEALRSKVCHEICQSLGVARLREYVRESDDEGPIRMHFYVSRYRDAVADDDLRELERRVGLLLETWEEKFHRLLEARTWEAHGSAPKQGEGAAGTTLASQGECRPWEGGGGSSPPPDMDVWMKYGRAFSPAYQQVHAPEAAIADILHLERLAELERAGATPDENRIEVAMAVWPEGTKIHTTLTIYSRDALVLNDIIPILEHMGLAARGQFSEAVRPQGARVSFVTRFDVAGTGPDPLAEPAVLDRLTGIVREVLNRHLADDSLLALGYFAGLDGREVELFLAYRNYFLQVYPGHAPESVNDVLLRHPPCVRLAARYFRAKFSTLDPTPPAERLAGKLQQLQGRYEAELAGVRSLQDDRVLRRFFSLFTSTLRTNFFKDSKEAPPTISFKVDARAVEDMPRPRPLFEIYVRGPAVDGIHLRGGKVARGGIRHSDRPDDFRTEVLGLMKTQMIKNSVIVPVGSKGGFVTHRTHADRGAAEAEARTQYSNFISGLLDLTDNIAGGKVTGPPGVLRYDGDDPYLVVAADKGTARLSDTANSISASYGFWLGDAFASGGSAGYDHKAMGITARGAWECVKRHFRELGVDARTEAIRVAGVGDMSGDVFGNGMLLSDRLKLVAAFDHRHIFIDPDPDPAASFAERKRLFALPRSSWADYDRQALSPGGGVYERSSKGIDLSSEARRMFGLPEGPVPGPDLVRRILTLDVDLLWLGGIGTYVKAGVETHADAGDKVNDSFRVDANELRAKVVGEGANLGFTQRARTEYALAGGRINQDALDNSAGVNCSDHEVNLKILLGMASTEGRLDLEARNALLREIEPDVAAACVESNVCQSESVSLDKIRSQREVESFLDLFALLESRAGFDRGESGVPSDETLREWAATRKGLPRNLLSEVASHAKNYLFPILLASPVADHPYFEPYYLGYFPPRIAREYGDDLPRHPLRREILATVLSNVLLNQAVCVVMLPRPREGQVGVETRAARYFLCDDLIGGSRFRARVRALDHQVPAAVQYEALLALEDTVAALVRWTNWNEGRWHPTLEEMDEVRPAFRTAYDALVDHAAGEALARVERRVLSLARDGLGAELPAEVAQLPLARHALAVVAATRETGASPGEAAAAFYAIDGTLHLGRMEAVMQRHAPGDAWKRRFRAILEHQLAELRARFLAHVLSRRAGLAPLEAFAARYREEIDRIGTTLQLADKSPTNVSVPVFLVLDEYRMLLEREEAR